uniref:Uncharacterized protein n=1 Tax=Trichogramma kaykai TaxID=54128 RepID=A0ABD2X4L8_9HYME
MSIDKYSINTEGIVSKVDNSQLTYPLDFPVKEGIGMLMFPLPEDKGYLYMEIAHEIRNDVRVTMALIQPNFQRRNLTHYLIPDFSKFSLDNGLIGICTQNYTTLKCTQFGPDDEEINWFSTSLIAEPYTLHSMYNLPKGEGFLISTLFDIDDKNVTPSSKKLVKIGLDGKTKHYVNTDMGCERQPESYEKIFKDGQGNYCGVPIEVLRTE